MAYYSSQYDEKNDWDSQIELIEEKQQRDMYDQMLLMGFSKADNEAFVDEDEEDDDDEFEDEDDPEEDDDFDDDEDEDEYEDDDDDDLEDE